MNASFVSLKDFSRQELLALWYRHYRNAPFRGARNTTLIREISYSGQGKSHGGPKASTKRKLLKIAQELTGKAPSKPYDD